MIIVALLDKRNRTAKLKPSTEFIKPLEGILQSKIFPFCTCIIK
jgi:hypothetical protein